MNVFLGEVKEVRCERNIKWHTEWATGVGSGSGCTYEQLFV